MKIGLMDVDAWARGGKVTFPNLALMKLSAWHKARGDAVEWIPYGFHDHYDRAYLSKVFSDEYSADYPYPIDADEVIRAGSGYAITVENGVEVYHKDADPPLPAEIEHIYPDYSIYPQFPNTAYGFLTRGCPRGCQFCHVAGMQGRRSHRVASLDEFWHGQKNIVLLDANISACPECIDIFAELASTEAYVEFNQGLDARIMTTEKIRALNRVKYRRIHFAWDKPEEDLRDDFKRIAENLERLTRRNVSCYVLTNFGSSHQQDLERIMFLRELDIQPYVMIYRKKTAPEVTRRLARWVNNPWVFWTVPSFDGYVAGMKWKNVLERQTTLFDVVDGWYQDAKE